MGDSSDVLNRSNRVDFHYQVKCLVCLCYHLTRSLLGAFLVVVLIKHLMVKLIMAKLIMEEKPMQHNSPAQLATLDRQAFQTFYQENLRPIYRYVYSKVRNREEAEDLTSQIFIKAVRNIDQGRNPQITRNWLFQVARTTIADYWRVYYRQATNSLDALLEVGWESPAEEAFPVISSLPAERAQHILSALPARYQEVLTCRFLLNLSIRETALKLGETEGNVKVLQFRALKRAADLEGEQVSHCTL